jgi:hypothetical protein
MIDDDVVLVDSGTGTRRVRLGDCLDAPAEQRATSCEHGWIKRLRLLRVDGMPMRQRFTHRGDSLWWFSELYLHKERVILNLFRAIAALECIVEKERPLQIDVTGCSDIVRDLARHTAAAHRLQIRGGRAVSPDGWRLMRIDARAIALTAAALGSRVRGRLHKPAGFAPAPIAAFVHRAFWRGDTPEGSAESYIGPVLEELERRDRSRLQYVGIGPSENFRARRWWHVAASPARGIVPVEALAPVRALKDSLRLWRDRHAFRRELWNSSEIRQHAVIAGYDCWNVVREQLAGIALLQWPWSARAMDEAAAALDVLRPAVALTYAEAGGWGRALVLEARRRGVATIGLQHGFIYESWLNYLHEPDEMRADDANAADRGFPRPTVTLLFDEYARAHLEQRGRFPGDAVKVTGSPRLDALVRGAHALGPAELDNARRAAGAEGSKALVLFVAKYKQARHVLPPLVEAVELFEDVQLLIKTHPAETPDAYGPVASGRLHVRVLPAEAPLAPLLMASRAVVTVNSTVALDAAVLGIPSLVIGLPNNLSPFVDAGIMAGAGSASEIATALRRILYDEEFRLQLERERRVYLRRFGIDAAGDAAVRSADAVYDLLRAAAAPPGSGEITKGS